MPEMLPALTRRAEDPAHSGQTPASLNDAYTRHLLAAAVAEPGRNTLLLDGRNNGAGWVSLWWAVHRDASFAVRLHPRLLVADVDVDADAPDGTSDATRRLEQLVDAAASAGVPHLVVDSGTGWHLYLVVGDDLPSVLLWRARAAVRTLADPRYGNNLLRPPGTRHRQHRHRRARPLGVSPAEALEVLTGPSATPQAVAAFADAVHRDHPDQRPATSLTIPRALGGRRDLPDTYRAIAEGDPPPAGSRSEPQHRVACAAAAAGWTVGEWITYALPTWIGARATEKAPHNPSARLAYEYDRAVDHVTTTGAQDAGSGGRGAEAQRMRVALARHPGVAARWWREGGQAVLDAVLALVAATGGRPLHLSVRAAAEAANVSKSAAHRHLVNLEGAGLIDRQVGEGSGAPDGTGAAGGALVHVHLERVHTLLHGPQGRGACQGCPTSEEDHADGAAEDLLSLANARTADAFTWRGLGKGAWRVWLACHDGPPDPAALGISPSWCTRLAARLARHGLLDDDGRPDPSALADAAVSTDTAGRLATLRQVHQDERDAWAPVAARIDAAQAAPDGGGRQLTLEAA
jgi:DNA-binding IscR family transcriptional regulator